MAETKTYPRIPESTWWILRDQFSRALPTTAGVSYLKSLLRLGSEKTARNLIPNLKQLGLIDDDAKPTARANDWRSNSRYAEVCKQMLEDVYPEDLRSLYSGNSIDRDAVADWFKYTGQQGDSTAKQSAAMYILLNDATPRSSEDFKKKANPTKKAEGKKNTNNDEPVAPAAKQVAESPIVEDTPQSTVVNGLPNPVNKNTQQNKLSLHIDMQIHISPDATLEQIDQIFASMALHFNISATTET